MDTVSGPPSVRGRAAGRGDRAGSGSPSPMGAPWTRMLIVGTVCFVVWLLLDAPSLQHSAVIGPVGSRRTVAMDVVGPIAAVSRALGLSHVVGWTDQALGRTPGGGPPLASTAPAGAVRPPPIPRPRWVQVAPAHPSTTTTTAPPALNLRPSASDPLRVLVLGDSIGIDLGQALVNDMSATGVVTPVLDGRLDTGLARPDYFDWPAELRVDLATDRPQLVVVMLGANDPQGLVDGGSTTSFGSPAWNAAYGRRVGAFVDEANAAGAHVLWVGMPPMAGAQLNGEMEVVNAVVESQITARRAGATYLPSVDVLGDGQGNFTAYLPDASGTEVNIRTPDGVHLAPGGGERLAQAVLASMRSTLHIDLRG